MATPALPNSGGTAASALPAAGGTSEQTLSSYIGPYVTNMLGKSQAVANEPYQVYQGPMTAGQSNLQSKVFQGLGGLNFPGNLGKSFASPMGGQQPQYGGTSAAGGLPPGAIGNQRDPGAAFRSTGMRMEEPVPSWASGSAGVTGNNGENGGPIGSSLSLMGSQPMPDYLSGAGDIKLAVEPTEADWNMQQQMAMYTPGTDMAKAKADFMSGGGKNLGGPEMGAYNSAGGMQPQVMQTFPQQGGIASLTPPPPQGSQQPSNIAQSYMNPYLQSVLNPQMDELRRQNEITNMQANAKLTGAGAFGGGRQAIMNAENARNLMQEQNKTVGQGYASAYDKAMGQFNTEQGQSKDLVNMLANAGQAERGIEQEGITADYNEFLAQRDDPMKKTQYLQSMLQGLPISTVTNSPLGKSGMGQLAEITGSMPSVEKTLRDLGLLPPA